MTTTEKPPTLREMAAQEFPCLLCGDLVHYAPTSSDEWGWADREGRFVGLDSVFRHLPNGDPYARLAELADLIDVYHRTSKAKRTKEMSARWYVASLEYGALKTRMEMGGKHHVHHAPPVRFDFGETVVHCGLTAWLRPSGWQCRTCREKLSGPLVE